MATNATQAPTAGHTPRTLRELWADEDEAGEGAPRRRHRRIRQRAKQSDRLRLGRRGSPHTG